MHNYRARRMQMDGDFHTFDLSDVDAERRGAAHGEDPALAALLRRHHRRRRRRRCPTTPSRASSRAALAPKDLEGVGVLTWRFNDWTTWDQVWAYLPTIRRVRRVRSSTRGDRIPGFEVQGDDADCYDNKTSYFTWKLVGAGEVIGPLGSDDPVRAHARRTSRRAAASWSCRTTTPSTRRRARRAPAGSRSTTSTPSDRCGSSRARRRIPTTRPARSSCTSIATSTTATTSSRFNKAGELYRTNFCGTGVGALRRTARFAAPTALLMLGVNEKENRGTPAGRFTQRDLRARFRRRLVHHRAPRRAVERDQRERRARRRAATRAIGARRIAIGLPDAVTGSLAAPSRSTRPAGSGPRRCDRWRTCRRTSGASRAGRTSCR